MRRGLMGWDPAELPAEILENRRVRLQARMREDGLDAVLLYTNFIRSAAVTWVTGFTPYWADALLLVPAEGEPVFATTLSKRVANWIRSVNPVGEIATTPRPGRLVGERCAGLRRIGILQIDAFPAILYNDVAAAAPGAEIVDATACFAAVRTAVDEAEANMLARTDGLALAGLDAIPADARDAGTVAAAVEQAVRLGGAEEVYIAVAPDLDHSTTPLRRYAGMALGSRFAVRVSCAYKGSWVRRIRSFAVDETGRADVAIAEAWLAGTLAALRADQPAAAQITAAMAGLPGAELGNWLLESSRGTLPLEPMAGQSGETSLPDYALSAGAPVVLTVALRLAGRPWLGAAPGILRG
jgi:Xaa-Pro aminopeptidase